ncbi:MAG: hypothetical protein HN982_03815 [Candidatus Marinimicrobia bacterium]|nr:hypothetical protein [Candidatus Woesearchaeota archaeon]MBT6936694.1 hypothetical protein [Candidatus Neomarinimicrobiota bacterium]
MTNDVKVLKLITGEEVIARITKEENSLITLEKPMTLQMMSPNTSTGQMGFAMVPWLVAAKNEKIAISTEHILVTDDASDQTGKNYLQIVTGLSL